MAISAELKARIVQQMFEGYTVKESLASLKRFIKSKTTITNQRDAFLSYEEEMEAQHGTDLGLQIAARKWNVTPTVERLVAIGREARRNNVEIHELVGAVFVARVLLESKVEQKDLQRFLKEVYKRVEEKGYTVEDIVEDCEEWNALEEKYKKSFDAILKEYTKMGFLLPQLRKDLGDLKKEISDTEDKRDQILAKTKATEEKVDRFLKARAFLVSIGFTLEDAEKARNVLSNLRESKFSAKKVVSRLKTIESLDGKIAEQEGEFAKGETLLGEQEQKLVSIKGEIKADSELLKEADAVEDTGLSLDQMAKLRKTVVRISSAKGIAPKVAMARFEKEVKEKYGLVLGFEEYLKASAKAKKIADGELKHQKELVKQAKQERAGLERQYRGRRKEVEAYSKLRRRGVSDSAILRWDRIVAASNLTPNTVESELVKQGNLAKLEAKARARIEVANQKSARYKAEGEEFRKQNARDWDSVTQYRKLLEKGVTVKALQRWEKLVVDAGLEPGKLEDELLEQKTLNRTKEKRERKLADLATKTGKAKERIKSLNDEVRKLEANLNTLRSQVTDETQAKTDIDESVERTNDAIKGIDERLKEETFLRSVARLINNPKQKLEDEKFMAIATAVLNSITSQLEAGALDTSFRRKTLITHLQNAKSTLADITNESNRS